MDQPKGAAYVYFKSLQAKIERQAFLWLNPNTQIDAAKNFAAQFSVVVKLSNAAGLIFYSSDGVIEDPTLHYPGNARTWALKVAAMNKGSTDTYYAFYLVDPRLGTMITVSLSQANSAVPKNQLCFRKAGLNRLN